MPIFDLFSKRQKRLRGELPDVYTYTAIPESLRAQIVHIWSDVFGKPAGPYREQSAKCFEFVVDTLRREYGVFHLPGARRDMSDRSELTTFFLNETDVERVLDVIELTFRLIDRITRSWDYGSGAETADAAIEELNTRFREHAIGYEYASGDLIRVDSELIHAEVVRPTLVLLSHPEFAGAQQEFLAAHEHYRRSDHKAALNECLKALESTLKVVCARRGWPHSQTPTASELLRVCFENGLIPDFWQQNFTALRSSLESSVPTGRNKLGGHGQGSTPVQVPAYLVAYMLHMTASAILFLVSAEQA